MGSFPATKVDYIAASALLKLLAVYPEEDKDI